MSSEKISQFHILCEKVFAGVYRSFSHSESNQIKSTLETLGPAIIRAIQEVFTCHLQCQIQFFRGNFRLHVGSSCLRWLGLVRQGQKAHLRHRVDTLCGGGNLPSHQEG